MKVLNIKLKRGFVDIYDFGGIKLHCYQTNDLMNDESYILENDENVKEYLTFFCLKNENIDNLSYK